FFCLFVFFVLFFFFFVWFFVFFVFFLWCFCVLFVGWGVVLVGGVGVCFFSPPPRPPAIVVGDGRAAVGSSDLLRLCR
uniref:hypothetical protein n=1 Tax=Escherichia coli TaxID=562 RepID=UPI002FBD4344